jgi:hypothetical protein
MHPVDQRLRREVFKGALRRLASGKTIPRNELFPTTRLCGPTENAHKVWAQRLAAKLVDQGIAERLGQGTATSYRLTQTDDAATRLQELSTNVEALSHFVFGSGGAVPYPHDLGGAEDESESSESGEAGESETGPGGVTEVENEEPDEVIEEPGDDEAVSVRLEFALKLLAAVLENVIYIRDRQREQGERMKEQGQKLRELEEAFR